MNGAWKHPLPVGLRSLWLAVELSGIAINYVLRVLCRAENCRMEARVQWLQWACRRVIRVFSLEIRAVGPIPKKGLLVSNHLSYLDILVLSALTPSVFVAKREVKRWPVFGWFARLAGTLFVDRERRIRVGPVAKRLQTLLDQGALVVLFPEGTSSDGQKVLPFKSALLEPAANSSHPVSVSAIEYDLRDGDVGEEVCYWKDMTFLPHLVNLLSKGRIAASVRFCEVQHGSADRKQLARRLHAEVSRLRGPTPSHLPRARFVSNG